jgi:hypothetical protein
MTNCTVGNYLLLRLVQIGVNMRDPCFYLLYMDSIYPLV